MSHRNRSWIDDPVGQNDINLFGADHQRRQESWHNRPKVQILTPREPPKKEQVKICSECSQRLIWLSNPRRWICYGCSVTFDENYTKPLVNLEQSIKPIQSDDPYTREEPFFISKQVDRRLQGEYKSEAIEEVRSYDRGRVRHIKLKPGVSPAAYDIHIEEDF
jgi:hypothetical protein